MNVPVYRIG